MLKCVSVNVRLRLEFAMSDRLTVVFDDPSLYRRLKVRAAVDGAALKDIIQEAVAQYLGPDPGEELKPLDWDVFDAWQADLRAAQRRVEYPEDLSDIKKHLYSLPEEEDGRVRFVAEEAAEYQSD